MAVLYCLLAICLLSGSTQAQLHTWKVGECKDIQPTTNFDLKKLLTGPWYEYKYFGGSVVPEDSSCVAGFGKYIDEFTIRAVLYWYNSSIQQYMKIEGSLDTNTKLLEEGVAKIYHKMYLNGKENLSVDVVYNILNIDYDNYAVSYTCQQQQEYIFEMFWVIKRERLSTTHDDVIGNILSEIGMDYNKFTSRSNSDCPPNEPIL